MNHVATPRTTAATGSAFFAARRASDAAKSLTTEVTVDIESSPAHEKVDRQKRDQVGAGQLACLAAVPV